MFGGQRLKRTCIASNQSSVLSLGIKCDGQHLHAPWTINDGVFDTSLEAEYTPMLAKALATTVLEAIAGEYKLANVQQFSKKLKTSHFHALAAAKQPTKPLTLAVVPEFSHVVVISCVPTSVVFAVVHNETTVCTHLQLGAHHFWLPKYSKLLRKTFKEGEVGRLTKIVVERTPSLQGLSDLAPAKQVDSRSAGCGAGCVCSEPCNSNSILLPDSEFIGTCCDWVFGIRWSPEEFVHQSLLAEHPFENFSGLLDDVRVACDKVSSTSAVDIINMRCSKLGSWLRLVKEFSQREKEVKSNMSPERRHILQKKQICLMKHVIDEEGYHDATLADDLAAGFSLVGETPKSYVLPSNMQPATLSTAELERVSDKSNKALRFMTRSCGDADMDHKLWQRTLIEVERGWLVGPLEWEALPPTATVSRRFPILQSDKVRPIDDFSQSQVNSTVTSHEQATVDGPDVICSLALYLMKRLQKFGKSTELQGRALDLSSAYRQLPIKDDSRKFAFLAIYNPETKSSSLFQQVALPFGSKSAVHAFIRCARFLQWAAARCLALPMSCYFDDFVSFTTPALAKNMQASLCLMLDIFGWAFDKVGPKSDDFSSSVAALGVIFDLSHTSVGRLLVGNTERRLHESIDFVRAVSMAGTLSKKDSLVLRGRLGYCDAFIFGRIGKMALQNITRHAYTKPFSSVADKQLLDSLSLLEDRLVSGIPRCIDLNIHRTFYLFTDASFDPKSGSGLGAVLFDDGGNLVEWFGFLSPVASLSSLLVGDRETAIVLAMLIWGTITVSSRLMIFIDNEGARYSLIKGYAKSQVITNICVMAGVLLDGNFSLPWFGRVPSHSNIADYPSRLIAHPMLTSSKEHSRDSVVAKFEECLGLLASANSPHKIWVGAVAKAGGVIIPSSEKRFESDACESLDVWCDSFVRRYLYCDKILDKISF